MASVSAAAAQSTRRAKKPEQAAPASQVDKRDRVIAAPGTTFNGRSLWQASAQCGGIYYKLGVIYSDAAARAKVAKPDPAAYAQLSKDADGASKTATAFFEAAERFLIEDRKVTRDEAMMTYDSTSGGAGDRVKTSEAALQAAKPCPELYKICRTSFPQLCSEGSGSAF